MLKILLAIDDSKFSEAATQAVLRQFRSQDTEVRVLHVVEPVHVVVTDVIHGYIPDMEAVRQAQLKEAGELVERVARVLQDAGMRVSTAVSDGDPKLKIIDYAAEWEADLIVVGSHGRKGLERLLLGSVSAAVANHARCSALIVRIAPNR
ncbi:MAG: universal stress protein [Acidobacteria bacterium]|nr:universal stress protein [Acidobacteriota bacterium]